MRSEAQFIMDLEDFSYNNFDIKTQKQLRSLLQMRINELEKELDMGDNSK